MSGSRLPPSTGAPAGARRWASILLWACTLALSPVVPEILAARELHRGTLQLLDDIAPYCQLGIQPPPLHLLLNRVHPVSLAPTEQTARR